MYLSLYICGTWYIFVSAATRYGRINPYAFFSPPSGLGRENAVSTRQAISALWNQMKDVNVLEVERDFRDHQDPGPKDPLCARQLRARIIVLVTLESF